MNASQLLKHFDRLAEAPDAVARLRRFILDLAVRGKLVEQDVGDEPALELLKRIAAQKAELVKEGLLREQPVTIDVPPSKQPYEIKLNWKWATFGSIMISRDGERIPVSKEIRNTREKIYDYYGASGVIDKIDEFLFEKPLLLIGEDGANLINRSTPIAFIARGKYWVNNHAHVLDGISENFLKYIELYINAIDLKAYVTGTAQPKMNQAKMNSIPVAIPPEKEQHRIVAKVDELMALCDQLEAAQQERERRRDRLAAASLQRLNQPAADATPEEQREHARFHLNHLPRLITRPGQIKTMRQTFYNLAVCGKLVDQKTDDVLIGKLLKQLGVQANKPASDTTLHAIPATWAWVTIEQIANVSSGTTPSRDVSEYYSPDGTPWVTSGETSNAFITETGQHVSDRALKETSLKLYPPGTLIVAMYGQGKTRGQVAELSIAATTNQACAAIVLKLEDVGHRRYVKLFFQKIYEEIRELAAGGAQPNLNGGKIKATLIPLPPLAEQHRIVAKVDELMALCDKLEAQLTITQTDSRRLLEAVLA